MKFANFVWLLALAPLAAAAQEDTTDLQQVIVTAARSAEPLDAAIASVTVITRTDIDRLQPHSVLELLDGLVGITSAATGDLGKASSVFVRGTNSDHVLVLIDGIKIGSATTGTPAWEQLPVEQIDRIEIVRGPGSSLYGSEAIGGVVQIFTRHGMPGAADVPSFMASGGSHGTYQTELGDSGSVRNGWYNASASGLYTNGIPICASGAPPSADCYTSSPQQGYYSGSGLLNGGWRWEQASANLDFLRTEGLTKYDGNIYSADESRIAQQVLGGSVTVNPAQHLGITLAAGESEDRSQNYYAGQNDGFFNTRRDTASLINELSLPQSQRVLLGADFEHDAVSSDAGYAVQSRNDTGAFGLYQGFAGHQELQLSARYDHNEQFGDHTTGSAQWAYRWDDGLRLTALWGSAFKAPTFNDLYYPYYGVPTLQPETSHSIEVGVAGQWHVLSWAVNAYQTDINDLIEYDPATFAPANIDSARIRGVEAQLGVALHEWRVQLQLTGLDPRDTGVDSGELLPLRSEYTVRLDVDRDIGTVSLGGTLFAIGPTYEDPANTERLGGYTTLAVRASWRFQPRWQLQALLSNAFNKEYETVQYYNQPGRSAYLTLRYVPGAT